jgi:SH3-like domain-containing protein
MEKLTTRLHEFSANLFQIRHIYSVAICLTLIQLFSVNSIAEIKSGHCKPYYASLKSDRVNSHCGPGKNYKIVFEYIQRGVPVAVVAQYDHWRKIKDPDGAAGWIHKSLLSPKRFVISVCELSPLVSETNDSGRLIAKIKKNVVMELVSVRGNWCHVRLSYDAGKYEGWIKKEHVFGVFKNETW